MSSWQNCTPLELFCSLSSGGDHTVMPITPGITSIIAPEMADMAGRPF